MTRIRAIATSPVTTVLLVATYPVLFLWSRNANGAFSRWSVAASWLTVVVISLIVCAGLRLLLRDLGRAALVTVVLQGWFLSFGHVAGRLSAGPDTSRERWLLGGSLFLVAGLVAVIVARGRRAGPRFFGAANLVVAGMALLNVPSLLLSTPDAPSDLSAATSLDTAGWTWQEDGQPRDVYYLVFDRYANGEVLRELYDFDNSAFLGGLRDRGFTVVDDAVANYPQTAHSLASSLNVTYLDDVAQRAGSGSADWGPIWRSLTASTVARTFDDVGYRTVHIGSWWAPTRGDPSADTSVSMDSVGEFSTVLIGTSAWPAVTRVTGLGTYDFRRQEYQRVGFQFEAVREVATDPAPTFTFAHVMLPHPPYIFNADGSFSEEETRPVVEAYLEQLTAANAMISSLVDDLLAGDAAADPIIIIQSDEGPYPPEVDGRQAPPLEGASDIVLNRKMRILSAMYLPGAGTAADVSRTPVNTFRMILTHYFGADLPALPERSNIFTDPDHPYRFVEVTDRLNGPMGSG